MDRRAQLQMGEGSDDKRFGGGPTDVDPSRLPHGPQTASRIDTLPVDFFAAVSRRALALGDVIGGRYRLVEALGDGAMGQVFVAENVAMGGRVAVKLLKPSVLADTSFRQRLQREAMAISAIEHRNVARFIDLVVGDPTFLVMEFVPGPTLASVLRRERRLEPVRAVNIVKRLCWALDAVHRAGVIHRDIKPANVILAPDPELGEEPKLIDFGLAKLAFANPEDQLTRDGQFVGTPHYMSPEQISSSGVDARSDVYSLGCLLYHLISGRPPFGGTDDVQVLYKQIEHEPEPVRILVAEAPLELERVVTRALAKDPERRFGSMREMVEALGRIERRRPEDHGTPAPPTRSAGQVALAVMAMILVAIASASVMSLWQARSKRGLLVVTSLPSGAHVTLDGRRLPDPTPVAVSGLAAGKHRLHVEERGHAAVDRVLQLETGERNAIDVTLPSESHTIEVRTIPAGAAVFLDGVHISGETPLTLTISDDDFHELRLEKLGYEPETEGVKPEDRGAIVASLLQEKQPHGLVWVDSNSAADVFIDGKDTGYSAPTIGIRVPTGEHRVELRDASGARSAPATVDVKAGQSLHVTLGVGGLVP